MTTSNQPSGVHLVGSAPVADAEEMFRLLMEHLGNHLRRVPDGEVGERDTWIRWQFPRILASEQIEQTEAESIYVPSPPMCIADGVLSADEIQFPNLGYADSAIESYAVFRRLQDEGAIPGGVRFMVGLPTPLSVAIFYVEPSSRETFETAYARALQGEFARMLEVIPGEYLSIQWETVAEFGLLEGLMENHMQGDLSANIANRLAALIESVPEDAEAGIHLCYGDSGHKHFCEPGDATYLVQVANDVSQRATRDIGWIHMPVPKEREDAKYFLPLKDLDLQDETELYLGLVHQTGGIEATRRRISAASGSISNFGVATECGLGRRDRSSIPALLDQHAEVSAPVR